MTKNSLRVITNDFAAAHGDKTSFQRTIIRRSGDKIKFFSMLNFGLKTHQQQLWNDPLGFVSIQSVMECGPLVRVRLSVLVDAISDIRRQADVLSEPSSRRSL